MDRNSSVKRIIFVLGFWLGGMSVASSFTSCYGHNCDGSTGKYGLQPGEGEFLTPDIWVSNRTLNDSLPFTRERTIDFEVSAFGGRVPFDVRSWVSAERNPTSDDGNETSGSGNLAEVFIYPSGRFTVHNDTCADYFVRVVAYLEPLGSTAPSLPAGDGGNGADAGGSASPP